MSDSLVIFLHSTSYDRVYQATNLVLTASSMGSRCHLFLFFGALASYVDGRWDDVDTTGSDEPAGEWNEQLRKSFDLADTPSLYKVLEMARAESGGLTICACSTSARFLGFETADVRKKVDEVVGLSTMLDIAKAPARVLYI